MFIRIFLLVSIYCLTNVSLAADLMRVYHDALINDPTYHERLDQAQSDQQGLAISIAGMLPNINASYNPTVTRSGFTGSLYAPFGGSTSLSPRNTTIRNGIFTISANQSLLNFAKFAAIASANAECKRALSTTYAALQDLIVRTGKAYFDVLKDQELLIFTRDSKNTYKRQLTQAQARHRVGLSTITEVYTAQTSYRLAVATYLSTKIKLVNDKEELRAITGHYYDHLALLSDHFPLLKPCPHDPSIWVNKALHENWTIRALQFKVQSAKETIKQQLAGHLPTVDVQARFNRIYTNNINGYDSLNNRNGPGTETDRQIGFLINFPIFTGGLTTAQTNQAFFNMRVAYDQLNNAANDAIRRTKQNYNSLFYSVDRIKENRAAIQSSQLSLKGTEISYKVGTASLIDVLIEQQKVLDAQTRYATDKYDFIVTILALKEAAGTLGAPDLIAINQWLIPQHTVVARCKPHRKKIYKT